MEHMARIIVNLSRGIVDGVYSDNPEEMQVEICDSDDQHDDIRATQYEAVQYLLKHAGMQNLLYEEDPETQEDKTPCLDPDVFVLIKSQNEAKSDQGKAIQRLSAAFVDGYLSAQGELSRFITKLYRDKHQAAHEVYTALRPLLDRQNANYDILCADLNRPEPFDNTETDDPL